MSFWVDEEKMEAPWFLIILYFLVGLIVLALVARNLWASEGDNYPQISKGDEFVIKKPLLAAREMRWIEDAAYIQDAGSPFWPSRLVRLEQHDRIRLLYGFECRLVRGWAVQKVNADGNAEEGSMFIPRSRINVTYMIPAKITVKESK